MPSIQSPLALLLFGSLLRPLLGCASAEPPPAGEPPRFPLVVSGFQHPESAFHDAESDHWFVSNLGEMGVPGDGFITRLDGEGVVLEQRFVEGLDDPKGIVVHAGVLRVTDLARVVVVELDAPESARAISVPNAAFLNDIAYDGANETAYVSDTAGNAIYRLRGDAVDELLRDPGLESPNGLAVRDGALLVASVGPELDPATFQTSAPGGVLSINLDTAHVAVVAARLGGLDGIEPDGGALWVSDTFRGLHRLNADGSLSLVLSNESDGLSGCADIGVDRGRRRLAVPELFGDEVTFFELDRLSP
jgi:hypothetical protein